ncbi:MAG: intradiol ring-cleavage dioxygenase [Planctomycetales bacterium]|nr:intradiol ring-cleavage dioxygenase [Planctomycetales bacterium]
MKDCSFCQRREFLFRASMGSAAFFTVPGAFAEELIKTPPQTEGPFYPDKLPLDTDNDLLVINDKITPAVGEITHLTGKVTDVKGNPIRNAIVKIWQTDNNGVYLHSDSNRRGELDSNFQGFGQFLTDLKGDYYFRTIKPTKYPGRTPHIHVAVERNGKRTLTTQLYIKGELGNEKDGIVQSIKDLKIRDSVMVDFKPLQGSKTGELTANFNIVLGVTPKDA